MSLVVASIIGLIAVLAPYPFKSKQHQKKLDEQHQKKLNEQYTKKKISGESFSEFMERSSFKYIENCRVRNNQKNINSSTINEILKAIDEVYSNIKISIFSIKDEEDSKKLNDLVKSSIKHLIHDVLSPEDDQQNYEKRNKEIIDNFIEKTCNESNNFMFSKFKEEFEKKHSSNNDPTNTTLETGDVIQTFDVDKLLGIK